MLAREFSAMPIASYRLRKAIAERLSAENSRKHGGRLSSERWVRSMGFDQRKLVRRRRAAVIEGPDCRDCGAEADVQMFQERSNYLDGLMSIILWPSRSWIRNALDHSIPERISDHNPITVDFPLGGRVP